MLNKPGKSFESDENIEVDFFSEEDEDSTQSLLNLVRKQRCKDFELSA